MNFAPKETTLLRDKRFLYIGDETLIDTSSKTVIHLPGGKYLTANGIAVAPNGTIFYLSNFTLYSFDPAQNRSTTLRQRVHGFTLLNNSAYFVEQSADGSSHYRITTGVWNGSDFVDFQTLVSDMPGVLNGVLMITDNKEL